MGAHGLGYTVRPFFIFPYPSHLGFAFLECVIRVSGQGIVTSHSKAYGEER